jgi:hypothetical protein
MSRWRIHHCCSEFLKGQGLLIAASVAIVVVNIALKIMLQNVSVQLPSIICV